MKIGGLLKHAHILYGQKINEKLKRYDLTIAQLDVLVEVIRANEKHILINQRDIEKKLNLTNPTVTGLINRLETKGLIERVENENDKRMRNLYVKKETMCFNKKLKHIFRESDLVALKDFNEDEKRELESYLERIITNLKKGEKE